MSRNHSHNGVYEGESAVLDYLDPEKMPYAPLVELPAALNPFRAKGVRIFAKLMNALPLGNIKSVPAYGMLRDARDQGRLSETGVVVESSSGNTAFSMTIIARLMGIPTTKAIVSHEASAGKIDLLRLAGTEIIVNEEPICPDPEDQNSGIYKARAWAEQNGWLNPGQYDNPANPSSHERWTAPQIWEQTRGKISVLCTGLGTTGTVVGIGRYLKAKDPAVQIVGVSRQQNNPVPGVRTDNLLKEVAFEWERFVDHKEEAGTKESYMESLRLCRHGLMVGPSSGLAFSGLLNYLSARQFEAGTETIAVFICPDSPLPYLSEYSDHLEESDFPRIENEHLLRRTGKEAGGIDRRVRYDIDESDPKTIHKLMSASGTDVAIIDLRTQREFEDHHIYGAEHVPFHKLDLKFKHDGKIMRAKKAVVFVCSFGNMSRQAAWRARQAGIAGVSMKGGDAEWSRLGLPRERPKACMI